MILQEDYRSGKNKPYSFYRKNIKLLMGCTAVIALVVYFVAPTTYLLHRAVCDGEFTWSTIAYKLFIDRRPEILQVSETENVNMTYRVHNKIQKSLSKNNKVKGCPKNLILQLFCVFTFFSNGHYGTLRFFIFFPSENL